MNIIIVGCGRVGSTVARECEGMGHSVVVIDKRSAAFRRLGEGFGGRTLVGVGFDRDLLKEAGVGPDCAVVAVTNGDNSNILVARVAREMFDVTHVVARINDPVRARIYERLGVATIATVAWASNRIIGSIMPHQMQTEWSDPTFTFHLVERRITSDTAGMKARDFPMGIDVLLRNGTAMRPTSELVLQEGDVVHVVGTSDEIAACDGVVSGRGGHQ